VLVFVVVRQRRDLVDVRRRRLEPHRRHEQRVKLSIPLVLAELLRDLKRVGGRVGMRQHDRVERRQRDDDARQVGVAVGERVPECVVSLIWWAFLVLLLWGQ
jgi:hypothetical protein